MDVSKKHKLECVDVNAHLHTPYSFSAFDKLTNALDRAVNENVKARPVILHPARLCTTAPASARERGEYRGATRRRKPGPVVL